jgi:hypothetical protein
LAHEWANCTGTAVADSRAEVLEVKANLDRRDISPAVGLFDVEALIRVCNGLRERVFASKAVAVADLAAEDMNDFEETMPAARATMDGML